MKLEEKINRVLTQILLKKYTQIKRVDTEQVGEFEIRIYFFVSESIFWELKQEIRDETFSLLRMMSLYDDYEFTVGFYSDYTTSE